MNWIKTSDRLPEPDIWVLVYDATEPDYSQIWIGMLDSRDNQLFSPHGYDHITHWMPLPTPPTGVP